MSRELIRTPKEREDFFKKVNTVPSPSGCHMWTGSTKHGYGRLYLRDYRVQAHRVAYTMATGVPIPRGLVVMHVCDNPSCVNPNHLRLGTHADNVADKVAKGRCPKGCLMPTSKLCPRKVREIRKLLAHGMSGSEIGRRYNVSHRTISSIKTGRTWKHVK